jgi:hypothetical protein
MSWRKEEKPSARNLALSSLKLCGQGARALGTYQGQRINESMCNLSFKTSAKNWLIIKSLSKLGYTALNLLKKSLKSTWIIFFSFLTQVRKRLQFFPLLAEESKIVLQSTWEALRVSESKEGVPAAAAGLLSHRRCLLEYALESIEFGFRPWVAISWEFRLNPQGWTPL